MQLNQKELGEVTRLISKERISLYQAIKHSTQAPKPTPREADRLDFLWTLEMIFAREYTEIADQTINT